MEAVLKEFAAVTGASEEAGRHLLEACGGNLEMAIGMHLDNGGATVQTEDSTSSSADGASCSHGAAEGSTVRAPIPQSHEQLVDEGPSFGPSFSRSRRRPARSVFDGFRDFQAETRQHELQLAGEGSNSKKRRTLEELFRPPVDLMFKGSFHGAKEEGNHGNRWLLVNIQNVHEFACQVLNRDVWSNNSVRDSVRHNFVFWQVYSDSEEGRKFMQFYKIKNWPYVGILDPRTGENMAEWNKIDASSFCELVNEFLAHHPRPDPGSTSPPTKRTKKDSIVDASEDSQLEAAIQASLTQPCKRAFAQVIDISSGSNEDSDGSDQDLETFSDSEDSDYKSSSCVITKTAKLKKRLLVAEGNNHSKTSSDLAPSATTSSEDGQVESISLASSSRDSTAQDEDVQIVNAEEKLEKWEDFKGDPADAQTELMIRYPNGERDKLSLPCSSKMKAVMLYVASKGYLLDHFDLFTNFPRKNLTSTEDSNTLEQVGLHPQQTLFVQER